MYEARWENGDKASFNDATTHYSIRALNDIFGMLAGHSIVNISFTLNRPFSEWQNWSLEELLRFDFVSKTHMVRSLFTKLYNRVVLEGNDMSRFFNYVFTSNGSRDMAHKHSVVCKSTIKDGSYHNVKCLTT